MLVLKCNVGEKKFIKSHNLFISAKVRLSTQCAFLHSFPECDLVIHSVVISTAFESMHTSN